MEERNYIKSLDIIFMEVLLNRNRKLQQQKIALSFVTFTKNNFGHFVPIYLGYELSGVSSFELLD